MTIRLATACLGASLLMVGPACDLPLPLRNYYELGSTTSVPKGVAFDPGDQLFFTTALVGGEIQKLTALGQEYTFYRSPDPKRQLTAAVVDSDRRALWVCAVDRSQEGGPQSALLRLDLDGESAAEEFPLRSDAAPSVCEAVTVDREGLVYAADSVQPVVYRHDPAQATTAIFTADPRLAPAQEFGVGLSGIAIHPTGSHLVVAKSDPPALFTIAIDDPTRVREVTYSGRSLGRSGDHRMPAAGGIGFVDEELFVSFPGAIQRIRFEDRNLRVARVHTTTAVTTGLSAVTTADEVAYVIESGAYQFERLALPPSPPFMILRIEASLFAADEARDAD